MSGDTGGSRTLPAAARSRKQAYVPETEQSKMDYKTVCRIKQACKADIRRCSLSRVFRQSLSGRRPLVFQDEVHFVAQTTIGRKWAKKGSKPKVPSKVGKDSVGTVALQ